MQAVSLLEKRVEAGELQIVQAIGVPRSMSTAFCRALDQTPKPSIYINEPFNRANQSQEYAAEVILSQAAPDVGLVIVKNMASYLPTDAFKWLEEISLGMIWNVRHPLRQMASLLTCLANDISDSEAVVSQAEMYRYLPEVTRLLIDSNRSKDFSKTGWSDMGYLHWLAAGTNSTVVDGDEFVTEPENVLQHVCALLGITYDDAMVGGWNSKFVNVVNQDNETMTATSPWTADAWSSKGVHTVERSDLDLEGLPDSLLRHITNVALPTYREFIA